MSDLPQGWVMSTLGALCSPPQYGWTTSARKDGSTGLKFLRTTDISRGVLDWSSVPVCADEPPNPEHYQLKAGDIVISRAGSVGLSYRLTEVLPAVFASYLIRFRPSPELDGRYLAFYLQTRAYWNQIAAATSGITLANVNAKKLSAVTLPLAPRAEQERIVAAIEDQFSRIDAGVLALDRVGAWITVLRRALLAAALDGQWPTVQLQEVAETHLGKMLSRKSKTGLDERPYLRNQNVQWGHIDVRDVSRMNFEPDERERFRLRTGDLLVCEGGIVGRCAIWDDQLAECYYQKALHRIRPSTRVRTKWIALVLEHFAAEGRLEAHSGGITIQHLPQEDLRMLEVPLPSLAEQDILISWCDQSASAMRCLESAVRASNQRGEALRSAILAAAFTGKLVPHNPTDEPASILLERIAAERPSRNGNAPTRGRRAPAARQ